MDRVTYWLWRGNRVVTSVRAAPGLDQWTVRSLALCEHQRIPLCYPTAPYEHARDILSSDVRTYPLQET